MTKKEGINFDMLKEALNIQNYSESSLYKFLDIARQTHNIFKKRGFYPIKHSDKIADFFNVPVEVIEDNLLLEYLKNQKKPASLDNYKFDKLKSLEVIPLLNIQTNTNSKFEIDIKLLKTFSNSNLSLFFISDNALLPAYKKGDFVFIQKIAKPFIKTQGYYLMKCGDFNRVKYLDFSPTTPIETENIIGKVVGVIRVDSDEEVIFC